MNSELDLYIVINNQMTNQLLAYTTNISEYCLKHRMCEHNNYCVSMANASEDFPISTSDSCAYAGVRVNHSL